MTRHQLPIVRPAFVATVCCALAGCNGTQLTAARMKDFEATPQDFDAIARAAFKIIDARGEVTTIVLPKGLDPRAVDALRRVHRITASAPGAPGTLPGGSFRVSAFSVEDGEAHLDGQLGPVTGIMTAANMPDCGKGYSVSFYIEAGDGSVTRTRRRRAPKAGTGFRSTKSHPCRGNYVLIRTTSAA